MGMLMAMSLAKVREEERKRSESPQEPAKMAEKPASTAEVEQEAIPANEPANQTKTTVNRKPMRKPVARRK